VGEGGLTHDAMMGNPCTAERPVPWMGDRGRMWLGRRLTVS